MNTESISELIRKTFFNVSSKTIMTDKFSQILYFWILKKKQAGEVTKYQNPYLACLRPWGWF
jgi:hypothetical protein